MIYYKNLLAVKILFENTSKRGIYGIWRPSVYLKESGNYCTTLRADIVKKEIEPGDDVVMNAILEAPKGFGEHLKEGAVLSVRNGLDEVGRALVLEIIGYLDEAGPLN
ncbi:MAG: hypothetical protein AB1458_03880 [Bacteroidota bacterium]